MRKDMFSQGVKISSKYEHDISKTELSFERVRLATAKWLHEIFKNCMNNFNKVYKIIFLCNDVTFM